MTYYFINKGFLLSLTFNRFVLYIYNVWLPWNMKLPFISNPCRYCTTASLIETENGYFRWWISTSKSYKIGHFLAPGGQKRHGDFHSRFPCKIFHISIIQCSYWAKRMCLSTSHLWKTTIFFTFLTESNFIGDQWPPLLHICSIVQSSWPAILQICII